MNTPREPAPDAHPIRGFVAASISESVRGRLAELQARLKKAGAAASWVIPENMHITILFLGYIFESQATALATALDGIAAAYRPCTLKVRGIGAFGRPHSPRVIWAGLAGALQTLIDLQREIAEAAKLTGIFTDNKPFSPHLTIGRVRSARNAGALSALLESCRDMDFGEILIDRVFLMKSELTARGPIYARLHESRLAAD